MTIAAMQIAEGGVGTAVLSGCDAALVRAGLVNLPCCTICDQRGGTKPWQVHYESMAQPTLVNLFYISKKLNYH